MHWEQLLSTTRLGVNTSAVKGDVRSEFERDADRVLFSGAFRRLSRKTQVHPLAANDHVHNRLTHSLETGQVGRALAKGVFQRFESELTKVTTASDLGAIVQAACLAHDIGNPPFGHGGEEAMMAWFATHTDLFEDLPDEERVDISVFDGNAQGFRIISQLENHLFSGGLRLTYATLAAFMKYPNTPKAGDKKSSVFLSEAPILTEVAQALGLASNNGVFVRHPLAYLVEAADDICYCVLDLEDAVELGILPYSDAYELLMTTIAPELRDQVDSDQVDPRMFRVNFSRLRGPVFASLIEGAIDGFVHSYNEIMAGNAAPTAFAALGRSDPRTRFIDDAKNLGKERIYTDSKKVEVELGAFATLDTLLSEMCYAARDCGEALCGRTRPTSWKSKLVLRLLGDHAPTTSNLPLGSSWTPYQCTRRAIDFVSGMTDNYATYLAKQIRGDGFTGLQRP